jgi:hypothetical protein
MTKIEVILKDASSLSADERRQLIELLCRQLDNSHETEEAVGRRGLAAWTNSTRDEDWSAHYPPELRDSRGRRQ